jgi:hypothetical protein
VRLVTRWKADGDAAVVVEEEAAEAIPRFHRS